MYFCNFQGTHFVSQHLWKSFSSIVFWCFSQKAKSTGASKDFPFFFNIITLLTWCQSHIVFSNASKSQRFYLWNIISLCDNSNFKMSNFWKHSKKKRELAVWALQEYLFLEKQIIWKEEFIEIWFKLFYLVAYQSVVAHNSHQHLSNGCKNTKVKQTPHSHSCKQNGRSNNAFSVQTDPYLLLNDMPLGQHCRKLS